MHRFVIVTLPLLVGILASCGSPPENGDAPSSKAEDVKSRLSRVRVAYPTLRTLERRLATTAKVTSQREGEVVPRVSGVRILKLLKDVGDPVTEGEVLAVLDGTALKHQVQEANLAVVEAERRKEEAALAVRELESEQKAHLDTVERKRQVWDRLTKEAQAVAQDEVDAAAYELRSEEARQSRYALQIEKAKVTFTLAENQIETAKLLATKYGRDLADCEVRSPMDGTVSARVGRVGQIASNGQALFRLFDPDHVDLVARLAQHHLRDLRVGQLARMRADAYPDVTLVATIGSIEPTVDENSGMVTVHLMLDGKKTLELSTNAAGFAAPGAADLVTALRANRGPRPGLFVSGEIILEVRPDVFTVPSKAVTYQRGRAVIYLVDPVTEANAPSPWRVRRLPFEVGLEEEESVQVLLTGTATLDLQQKVVLVGQDSLSDGDSVRLEESSSEVSEATKG